jgi:hypothetical protein
MTKLIIALLILGLMMLIWGNWAAPYMKDENKHVACLKNNNAEVCYSCRDPNREYKDGENNYKTATTGNWIMWLGTSLIVIWFGLDYVDKHK